MALFFLFSTTNHQVTYSRNNITSKTINTHIVGRQASTPSSVIVTIISCRHPADNIAPSITLDPKIKLQSVTMMKITSAILLVAVLLVSTTESFSPTVTVRKQISGLTKDNFDATLKEIEPFLTKDAGASFYAKSMRRIAVQANAMGATIPTDYAKEAKATAKRREKQKTFIEAKQEEAAAAVAEAAAAAAEAAAAVEEETPAEEETAAEEEAPAE